MTSFEVIEEKIWESPKLYTGGKRGELSQSLIDGKTVFIEDPDSEKRFNPYYSIAAREDCRLEVRKVTLEDGRVGRIGRFIKKGLSNG